MTNSSNTRTKSKRNSGRRMPKFEVVRETLREQIADGTYSLGVRLPSQYELARALKVNHLTVQRALQDLVSEGLVVRKPGSGTYVADTEHPPPLPGQNLRIGLLWYNCVNPANMRDTLQGDLTRSALSSWGLDDLVPDYPSVSDDEVTRGVWTSLDRGLTVEAIGEAREAFFRHPNLKETLARNLDGIIAFSIIEEDWLGTLLDAGIPVVISDFVSERFIARADQVFFDPLYAYRMAVFHLAALGLKRIFFVGTNLHVPAPHGEMGREDWIAHQRSHARADPDSFLRMNAWRQGMFESNLPVKDDWVHFTRQREAEMPVVANKLMSLPIGERPEAVVCHAARVAEFLVQAFRKQGLALTGVGSGASNDPDVLSVMPQSAQMGAVAASLLISRIQQPRKPFIKVGVPMQFEPPKLGKGPEFPVGSRKASEV